MKYRKIIYIVLFCFLLLGGCAYNTVDNDGSEPDRKENVIEKEDDLLSSATTREDELLISPTMAANGEPTLTPIPIPTKALEHPYVGKIVEFGTYEQDNNFENGKERIEWIVLDVQNDAALLLSKYCLDYKDYYFEKASETWLGSGMQKWLNTDFKENALSLEEKSYIVPTCLKKRDYTEYENTDDIFLLSVFDVDRYFIVEEAKIAYATNYASSKYPYVESPEGEISIGAPWYTRTEGNGSDLLTFVSGSGACYGGALASELCGVRPAMWVTIDSLQTNIVGEFGYELKNDYLWKATPAEYFRYGFEDGGGLCIGGVNESANFETLIVPDVIEGHSVDVLRGLSNLYVKEIQIPGSVYIIYGSTFSDCSNLERITISTELGPRFYEKDGLLYSDNRGGSLVAVPVNYYMDNYTVPKDVYCIEDRAFENCLYVEKVVVPKHVKSLEREAFMRCPSIKEVVIKGENTELGSELFKECVNLESVSLPDGMKELPYAMFEGCKNLKEIKLPDDLKALPYAMFEGCKNLKEIQLPDGLEQIEAYAFADCTSLESISLPEGLWMLEEKAFAGCENLKTIYLPESYNGTAGNPFMYCYNIETVYYAGSIEQWHYVYGKEYFGEAQIICKNGVYK